MTLFLLPNLLSEEGEQEFFPKGVREAVLSLHGLIAESERGGRRYLRRFCSHEQMAACPIKILNEHTRTQELDELLSPLKEGENWGLISDAGLPCIADPGAPLVLRAHQIGIPVSTFVGPSAPLLALQLSGLTGQRFAFHGYLPREPTMLAHKLKELEKRSRHDAATQLWIEAPYRSARCTQVAFEQLKPTTLFCIAVHLMSNQQRVSTQTIKQWRKAQFSLEKEPAIFLLLDIDSQLH
jgi:16S rRNA (cytidine1402-2'-O)-methyltransferase